MFDLKSYIADRARLVNGALERILEKTTAGVTIADAMRYSLMAGGKRIRPVLCMAAAEAVGHESEAVLDAACALEMIHTYSLIHDDLPAMDDDDLRRGRPTCHIAFDEPTAVLAGDALLTLAFHALSAAGLKTGTRAREWLEIIHAIADASGCQGMIEGQMRDVSAEGASLSLSSLRRMHHLKTGRLIEVSVWAGAALCGAERDRVERLRLYAENIGLAFQVADDILNVEGDPARMGKAVGTDDSREKNT
ncbi:MAG: polyprenyl synthetase family protein, partial [Desulfobacterales bacterium]|nr:polyprenyl synthetase family protein [Desulfobacterales bacterium]